ncbi:MAG: hypothetical protein BMS9Abin07_0714 [Acidimicrobiia bacterium]|nr:MAG: hypothetical protein BMS9Abin07_0714 [Acidimicrobiia bacterium]
MRELRRPAGLVGVAIAVLVLSILSAVGARSLPGTTRSLALSWTVDVIQIMQVGIGVLIIAAILWGVVAQRRNDEKQQRRELPRRRSSVAVLFVIAALALLILIIPRRAPSVVDEPPPDLNFSEVDFLPIENVGAAWPLLVLIAGVALAVLAVHLLTRQEEDIDEERADPGALVADSLTAAMDELSWSGDPRSVIIKAYRTIEAALGRAGLPHRPSEAPREYLHRVLTRAHVQPDSITRLTTLFELARYSNHAIDALDRRDAIEAMESVRSELGASRP